MARPAANRTIEPAIGTPIAPFTTRKREAIAAIITTSPFAQILANISSNGRSGMTSRCSILPCSRSRSTAAPHRKMASTEMLLITWLIATNQLCSMFGLKRARVSRPTTGRSCGRPAPAQ